MIRRSYPLRVLAISFLVLALPLLVDSFFFFKRVYNDSVEDIEIKLKEKVDYLALSLIQSAPVRPLWLKEVEVVAKFSSFLAKKDYEQLNEELRKINHLVPAIELSVLAQDKQGYTVVASSLPETVKETKNGIDPQKIEEQGETVYWTYSYDEEQNHFNPFLVIGRVIRSEETKKPLGILIAKTKVEEQLNEILESVSIGDVQGQFALVNQEGVVFAATNRNFIGQLFRNLSDRERLKIAQSKVLGSYDLAALPLKVITREDENPYTFDFVYGGQIYLGYYVPLPRLGISLLGYLSKEHLFGNAIRHFLVIYIVFALIFIIGGGITYWLIVWMSRPFNQLSQVMRSVSEGKLDSRFVSEPLGFEINLLGDIFNNTLDSLLMNMQKAEDEKVKAETYLRELKIGREVQEQLLPKEMPHIQGIELAATYLFAREVGGDFYDITQKGDDLFLTIVDTSGKGITSCLYALGVRSLLRTFTSLKENLGAILPETNDLFLEDTGESGVFATVLMGKYNLLTRTLSYYSCGHPPGIIRKPNGELIVLEHTGMALGLKKTEGFIPQEIQLERGDILLFYTDGLTGAENKNHQFFGKERLKKLLQRRRWDDAHAIVQGIIDEIYEFCGGEPRDEEISLLAMKILK